MLAIFYAETGEVLSLPVWDQIHPAEEVPFRERGFTKAFSHLLVTAPLSASHQTTDEAMKEPGDDRHISDTDIGDRKLRSSPLELQTRRTDPILEAFCAVLIGNGDNPNLVAEAVGTPSDLVDVDELKM